MVFKVRVIPKASRNFIKKENGYLKVYLTRPAQDGLANKQLLDLLAEYLGVRKYQIRIVRGDKTRNKVVEIDAS
jgi:hypothetical protein